MTNKLDYSNKYVHDAVRNHRELYGPFIDLERERARVDEKSAISLVIINKQRRTQIFQLAGLDERQRRGARAGVLGGPVEPLSPAITHPLVRAAPVLRRAARRSPSRRATVTPLASMTTGAAATSRSARRYTAAATLSNTTPTKNTRKPSRSLSRRARPSFKLSRGC